MVEPLWHPLAWALLLGTMLAPFNLRLADRLGGNRGPASALTLLGTVVLFVRPALIVAGELPGQAERLHGSLKLPDLAGGQRPEQIVSERLDDWLGQFAPRVHLSAARLHGWLVAMIAALLALIPVVGSALVWVPGALYLASHGQHGHAVFLAGWSLLLVGTIDHVLRPPLISGRGGLPTLGVFVGVFGGAARLRLHRPVHRPDRAWRRRGAVPLRG